MQMRDNFMDFPRLRTRIIIPSLLFRGHDTKEEIHKIYLIFMAEKREWGSWSALWAKRPSFWRQAENYTREQKNIISIKRKFIFISGLIRSFIQAKLLHDLMNEIYSTNFMSQCTNKKINAHWHYTTRIKNDGGGQNNYIFSEYV